MRRLSLVDANMLSKLITSALKLRKRCLVPLSASLAFPERGAKMYTLHLHVDFG